MGPAASAASRYAPRDPETFFHAQKRARHATWRMSALSLAAALVMGLPLTLIITPLLYAFALIAADLIELISPLPRQFWESAEMAASFVVVAFHAIANQKPIQAIDGQAVAIGAAIMLLPGIVVALLMWMGVHAFFRHGGVGGTLLRLQAREPNPAELQELQLADVAQEMAIAAGIPAPRILIADGDGANAAAVGTSAADARIVISRPMLELLDRQELEAVLAALIASIANGDLRIAFTVSSVFETAGLMVTLIGAPFARESRQPLWRIVRYAVRRKPADAAQQAEKEAEAGMLAAMLSGSLGGASDLTRARGLGKLLRIILFPFVFTNLAVQFTLWIFLDALLGPCMALVWRARRYLADASAVELTRSPDALASALQKLGEADTFMSGSAWAGHLFIINPHGESGGHGVKPTPEQIERVRQAWLQAAGHAGAPRGKPATFADVFPVLMEIRNTAMAAQRGDAAAAARMRAFRQSIPDLAGQVRMVEQGSQKLGSEGGGLQQECMLSFHPPLKRRLRRLARMGAHVTTQKMGRGTKIAMAILWLIIGPLLAVAGAMMLFLVAVFLMMNLVFVGGWLAAIHFALTAMRH
jgi:Zn-dependent protease with chaperone function